VNATLIRRMAWLLAMAVANPALTLGETPPLPATGPPAGAPSPPAQAPAQPVFSVEQMDQMTAPIALYPDDLLAQLLIAATYPLEIVQAERWASNPENAKLKGDQLAAALEPQPWDPSVKSLVPYPQVLKMMSDQLDWTQRLGDAFLAQQADVMASVQRLRQRAEGAGTLKTTEQQTVVVQPAASGSTTEQTIIIQPTNPEVVYVPTYNPTVVYGSWPYPAYPPPYYPPPPAYYPGYYPGSALMAGVGFGLGVASIAALSGCCYSNWGGGNVNINTNRYNTINSANIRSGRATQLPANASTWRHDPSHRGGVAYRDPGSRQAYQRGARPAAASRDFRGYSGGQWTSRPAAAAANRAPRAAGGAAGARPQATRNAGGGAAARASPQRQPSAFQGMGNGSQVRAQSDRGRMSMQSFQGQGGARASAARAGGGARASGARAGGGRGGRR
jgi:hypothetical protein